MEMINALSLVFSLRGRRQKVQGVSKVCLQLQTFILKYKLNSAPFPFRQSQDFWFRKEQTQSSQRGSASSYKKMMAACNSFDYSTIFSFFFLNRGKHVHNFLSLIRKMVQSLEAHSLTTSFPDIIPLEFL